MILKKMPKSVHEMSIGDRGFIRPWDIWHDSEKRIWVDSRALVLPGVEGFVKIGIDKLARGISIDMTRLPSQIIHQADDDFFANNRVRVFQVKFRRDY